MTHQWYLFDVNPHTLLCGHHIVGELRVGTSPRPVMAARLIVPRAVLHAARQAT